MSVLTGHFGGVKCVCISFDGSRIASGGEENTVRIWTILRDSQEAVLTGHAGYV
jgi:WD40 repeat protein